MNEIQATIVGNLTADPELRFTQGGIPVANFTVAQTPRVKDGDQWVDGEAIFVRCTVWREYAEHVAGSLQKGQRVIVQGRLKTETYQPRDGGADRLNLVLEVDEIGATLRFGTTQFTQAPRQGGGQGYGGQQGRQGAQQQRGGYGQGQQGYGQQRPQQGPPAGGADPWATAPAGMAPGGDPWATPGQAQSYSPDNQPPY